MIVYIFLKDLQMAHVSATAMCNFMNLKVHAHVCSCITQYWPLTYQYAHRDASGMTILPHPA